MSNPKQLKQIAEKLKKGAAVQQVTVKEFLTWFNAVRRGANTVKQIRTALEDLEIATDPDFERIWPDNLIGFKSSKGGSQADDQATYRIDSLESATKEPEHVPPDSDLLVATTMMGKRDFSQVPVWSSPREVKGVVSWRTIGQRLSLGRKMGKVADFMEDPVKVKRSTSLFDAVKLIMDYDYVLVEDIDKTICGIVTSSDIGDQFSYLAEPFLRVSEIENSVRRMIHGKFSVEELKKTTAKIPVDKKIEGVYDLTFGQYIQLLSGSGWDKIKINVDQKQFVDMLDQIRQIRNDVMHFNPDGIGEEDVEKLRECMNYLHMLQEAGAF